MKRIELALTPLIISSALAACADSSSPAVLPPGASHNVTQGGAQDFARFRAVVASGEVPSPDTLDEVGFFAEHALDLPSADCGEDICLHPMLAVAPRFNGGNWTMAFVAMNSPLDPSELERPDAHLVVVWDASYEPLDPRARIPALEALAAELRPEDRVSLVRMGIGPRVIFEGATPAEVPGLVSQLAHHADERVGLYDGLALAGRLAQGLEGFSGLGRVVLVTSGRADAGITEHARIVGLAEGLARDGVSLSVLAMGSEAAQPIAVALGEIGAGTFNFAASEAELVNLMRSEAQTGLLPLARDFELSISAKPGYRVGAVYGAARVRRTDQIARLDIPALYLGQRTGAQDVDRGRRGGGGGIFVELIADGSRGFGPDRPAAGIEATWRDVMGPTRQVVSRGGVDNVLAPGQNPPGMWPHFSDPARGKAFMMLNMYLALRSAVTFFEDGDCDRAIGLVDMMEPSLAGWQAEYSDPDIEDDRRVLMQLRHNLERACLDARPYPPRDAVVSCFMI